MTDGVAPPGWPADVPPPGAPEWERKAVMWLYDLCPHDYRAYDVLRRYPVVLARFAADHCRAAVDAARHGLATARAELAGTVPAEAIEAAIGAYEREEARLQKAQRAVDLVGQALAGRRFQRKL